MSVEHQLRGLETGDTIESEVRETISEAARFMYDQYLSQKVADFLSYALDLFAKF